ncbi:IPT/TIG domain-containing protein [Streptomyces malaysiensis]|uniref:IPT/TIG domain-containing protein n=1 Tax=Streptomyces malaysiensis TaxID=92644 RepID=UPI0037231A80
MAPVVTSVSPAQGNPAGGTSVTINGSGLTGATVVRFGSSFATNVVVVSDTQITATTPPGSGTAKVTVTTPGGTSTQNVLFTYTTAPAPTITSLFPSTGPAAGGNSVIIHGTNLSGAVQVLFGTTPGTILTSTPTQITATAPPGTGTVNVTVTTPNGTSNALPYAYTAVPAPTLTNLNPTNGPTAGGNTITITGTNLTGTTQLLFGTNPATTFTINSPTQITATAPAGPASAVNVTVTTPGGSSNPLPYIYVAAPTVASVSPQFGPATGGTTVTIAGSNLALATQVHFGPNLATGLTVVSDAQLTVTAPAGTGTVVVTVTTPGGTSTVGLGTPYYTYLGAPMLNTLIPNNGTAAGGDSVTIGGSNLIYTDSVTFGGTPASFTVFSDTIVVATAPAHAAGTVGVQLHTPAGNSNTLPFTYDPA